MDLLSTFRGRVIVLVVLLMVSCTTNTQGAPATPQTEAIRLTTSLTTASTSTAVSAAVIQLLDVLGVPVYNAAGKPLRKHKTDDLTLAVYEIEVEAVSQAFLRGSLTPLDTVVADWSRANLTCGDAPCSGAAIEAMLRQMYAQAQSQPALWQGLLVRMVDLLGQRVDRPFSLGGRADTTCLVGNSTPTNPSSVAPEEVAALELPMAGIFDAVIAQALKDGDTETAAMLQAMQSSGGFAQMMAGLSSGDPSMMMSYIDAELDLEDESDGDGDDAFSASMMQGWSPPLMISTASDSVISTTQAAEQNQQVYLDLEQTKVTFQNAVFQEYVQSTPNVSQAGARALVNWYTNDMFFVVFADRVQAEEEYRMADWLVQVSNHILQDPPEDESWKTQRRGILAGGNDETSSCIYLDAVQLLLLQLELLNMTNLIPGGA